VFFAGGCVENPALKVTAELGLLAVTRWTVYRFYLDPILSWLPFLIAMLLFGLLFRPNRHDFKLLGIFLVLGPVVEILYIQVAGLHRYHLGWIGGVPLWIVLWWALSILIWKDIALRVEQGFLSVFGKKPDLF
jgi:hypothetical protein